jgi:uncharacterized phage-associated protein
MAKIYFQFNERKAIEVIIYLASRIKNPDIYSICKLLYLADKTNLEKYGRLIFGDTYSAMEKGATPSNAYNLLKEKPPSTRDSFSVSGYNVSVLREPNLEYLSKSDLESLDEIINIYENLPNWRKSEDAHDDAWRSSWEKRGHKKSVPIPIENIAKLFDNVEELIDYLTHVG